MSLYNVFVFLQAYRFLAFNKKLGLSGRPERPVGCIGTCKVFEYAHAYPQSCKCISIHAYCTYVLHETLHRSWVTTSKPPTY